MNDFAEVIVVVEGPTEQQFIKDLLGPYLANKSVFLTPIILDKPGQKGGDVKFARAQNDIGLYLKQRADTWVTLMVDYYGIRNDWPGLQEARLKSDPRAKAETINKATLTEVEQLFSEYTRGSRFIPYVSMHEFEALYFSAPEVLASEIGVTLEVVSSILEECGEAEAINDSPNTSPSHRLRKLSPRFKKTTTGIAIAKKVGLERMRESCPLFNAWVDRLELLSTNPP